MGLYGRRETRTTDTATKEFVDDVVLRALLTGEDIDADKALSIPVIASAVNRISTMVAILPVKLYKRGKSNEGKPTTETVDDDDRVYLLNVDSGDTLDQFATKKRLARDYLLAKVATLKHSSTCQLARSPLRSTT